MGVSIWARAGGGGQNWDCARAHGRVAPVTLEENPWASEGEQVSVTKRAQVLVTR